MNLPKKISDEVDLLCEEGNVLFDAENYSEAIDKWAAALQLLPEPRFQWAACAWICSSIGDAQYQLSSWDAARQSFYDALNTEDARANPFVHYRLGQCWLKAGNEKKGLESLLKAYMLDGEDIFEAEPDGPGLLQRLRVAGLA
jgi:tetratricopeptide (TPR) repeat protein